MGRDALSPSGRGRGRLSGVALRTLVAVEILAWLLPSGVVLVIVMVWAAWAGRPQREETADRSEAAYERFAAAIAKEHPAPGGAAASGGP